MLIDWGGWRQKRPNPSPISQSCRQHISSPTSASNIDVAAIEDGIHKEYDSYCMSHAQNTCSMCIWQMCDRLMLNWMLTNVHWLVLHDWIKPAGCDPIANSFIRDDVLSHNKKLIKSDCINTKNVIFRRKIMVFHKNKIVLLPKIESIKSWI